MNKIINSPGPQDKIKIKKKIRRKRKLEIFY